MPPGANLDANGKSILGPDGLPYVCCVMKPIYGVPQAGRRLQRKIFPWCTDKMGLKQLDDSDSCCFALDDPAYATETFAVGIYVDNMQIVHSAVIDENGDATDPNSYYAKFMKQVREDWEVVDEGPMKALLGIEVRHTPPGSGRVNLPASD